MHLMWVSLVSMSTDTEGTHHPTSPGNRADQGGQAETSSLRQPGGLFTLFSIEMWERFSFYGLQVILAYYIYYSVADGGLGLSQFDALAISGAYGGAVYLGQPVGAWFADRLIPARTMVIAGGITIMLGHISLASIPGVTGLIMGLAFIIIGTGALTPNSHAMVGRLYPEHDARRDSGYAIFYTGTLIGALVGPLVSGWLQTEMGFHYGFGSAALGMLLGVVFYSMGLKKLPEESKVVPNPLSRAGRLRSVAIGLVGLAVLAVLVLTGVLSTSNLNVCILAVIMLVSILYFVVILRSSKISGDERDQVKAFVPIFIVGSIFWTMILQLFTTFAVFADTRVDLSIGSYTMPAAYISTFQVVTGIIVGPAIAILSQKIAQIRGVKPMGTVPKLTVGFLFMTITYALFTLLSVAYTGKVPLLGVIVGMIAMGFTEVMIAPIGMSVASQLSPRAFTSQMMALWGLTTAAGASLSGFMGQLYSRMSDMGFFTLLTAISLVTALCLFSIRKPLQRLGLE